MAVPILGAAVKTEMWGHKSYVCRIFAGPNHHCLIVRSISNHQHTRVDITNRLIPAGLFYMMLLYLGVKLVRGACDRSAKSLVP